MDLVQLFNTLLSYSYEILIIAFFVCLVTTVLKKTILKKLKSKYYTLLPFVLGVVLYSIYCLIFLGGIDYICKNYASAIECGLSVGCIATIYYVVFEQFFRHAKTLSKCEFIKPFVEALILEENLSFVCNTIAEFLQEQKEDLIEEIVTLILSNASSETTEADAICTAKLIVFSFEKLK